MITLNDKLHEKLAQTKRSFTAYTLSRKSNPAEVLWSFGTYFLALVCLLFIFATSTPNNTLQANILSPIVTSIQEASKKLFGGANAPLQTFAFVPGDAPNRFQRVDLSGLNVLSFYDTPINADGTLNTETEAHQVFHSSDTNTLLQSAQQNGTKVLLTLTMTYHPDIHFLLNDQNAQRTLQEQTVTEIRETNIDGVTLAIEYQGNASTADQAKFSALVKSLTDYVHTNVPNAIVTVAIPDTADGNSLYDIKALSEASDKTVMMAYSFAVPEADNNQLIAPVFGFKNTDYLSELTAKQNNFLASVSSDKLLMERAWYGNGNKYPLYNMDALNSRKDEPSQNTLRTPLSAQAIERLVSDLPNSAKASARKNLPYIAEALEQEGILNPNVLAYAMATIQHETANTFEPIDEFKGRKSARRLGYEGGTDYFGRGFIQLTHLRNYRLIGERIGVGENLVKNPELASKPETAAKILAAYFKDFGIAEQAAQGNFVQARTLINPDYNGYSIAEIALGYLYALS